MGCGFESHALRSYEMSPVEASHRLGRRFFFCTPVRVCSLDAAKSVNLSRASGVSIVAGPRGIALAVEPIATFRAPLKSEAWPTSDNHRFKTQAKPTA